MSEDGDIFETLDKQYKLRILNIAVSIWLYTVSSQHTTILVPGYCIVLQFHIDYLSHASLHLPAMLSKSQPTRKKTANLNIEESKLWGFLVSCIKKFVVLQLTQVSVLSATTKRVFKPVLVCSYITSSVNNMKISTGGELCLDGLSNTSTFQVSAKCFHTEISW